jgi:hypothetical protein
LWPRKEEVLVFIIRKNRELEYGDNVRVYYNFHRKIYSIQKFINNRWLVVAYSNDFILFDCSFKVNQNGRNKVLKDMKKNVHAFIYGTFIEHIPKSQYEYDFSTIISYNPYKNDCFVCEDSSGGTSKIDRALYVKFNDKVVSAFIFSLFFNTGE